MLIWLCLRIGDIDPYVTDVKSQKWIGRITAAPSEEAPPDGEDQELDFSEGVLVKL